MGEGLKGPVVGTIGPVFDKIGWVVYRKPNFF